MDTIHNAASAASKAIWGDSTTETSQSNESGREPVSGERGDTSSGEPYDAGNKDPTKTTSDIPKSNTRSDLPGNNASTGPIRPEHDTGKTGVTSANQRAPGFYSGKHTSFNDSSGPGATPSIGADPASAQQDTTKQQGADGSSDEPEHGSDEHERITEAMKEAEEAQKVATSGPGPRPLAETGGLTGKSSGPGGDDEDDGPQRESHGEGSGEKWVKSDVMKADGGDFDAAAPGAGKEANRLLDEKGVHRSADEPPKDENEKKVDPLEAKLNKPSLGEKIKGKLHIGRKDKPSS